MTDLYKQAAELPLRLAGSRPVSTYPALTEGGRTRSAIRWDAARGRLAAPFRRTYVVGPGQPSMLDRLHALSLVLPEGAAVGFHTAAALHGFGVIGSDRVHIVVPRGGRLPQVKGVASHEAVLPFEPVDVLGVMCVPANRCAVDLARTVKRLDALPILDAALFSGVCTLDELAEEVARHGKLRGVRQARELAALADPRPACRQESQARLLLLDSRLPAPVPQLKVFDDDGYVRCVLDLAYEDEHVGLEYDGASHLSRERMRSDRSRHNWLEGRGWAMRYITDWDLYQQPRGFIDNLRAALFARRRAAIPRTARRRAAIPRTVSR